MMSVKYRLFPLVLLTLLVRWQKGNPDCKYLCHWYPKGLFPNNGGRKPRRNQL